MSRFCDAHRAEHNVCGHHNYGDHSHCAFDIWAPNRHSAVNNTAFSSFAYHQQKIEDFITALAEADNPNDFWTQRHIARKCNVNIDDFSDDEREYIESEVSKRI